MTRRSKREIERILEDLQGDTLDDFEVSSSVVTITDDMTDDRGRLAEDAVDAPGGATVHPTESDVVTVWSTHMD